MKIKPPALAAIAALNFPGLPSSRDGNVFYATCAYRHCRRLRTFHCRADAQAAGWRIGQRHHLCPLCARKGDPK